MGVKGWVFTIEGWGGGEKWGWDTVAEQWVCCSYLGEGIGLHSVVAKKDIYFCSYMKGLYSTCMYIHVIEYSKVWAYMQLYVSVWVILSSW